MVTRTDANSVITFLALLMLNLTFFPSSYFLAVSTGVSVEVRTKKVQLGVFCWLTHKGCLFLFLLLAPQHILPHIGLKLTARNKNSNLDS